jgi:hypothetical protein
MVGLGGMGISTDDDGNTVIRGPDGGTVMTIAPNGQIQFPPPAGGDWTPTFTGDLTSDDAIRTYTQSFSSNNITLGTVTVPMMRSYLETHKDATGRPVGPANADAWEEWLTTEYEFDPSSEDDVNTVIDLFYGNETLTNATITPTPDAVRLWLAQNDGKMGSAAEYVQFARTAPDTAAISGFINSGGAGVIDETQLGNFRRMVAARDLLAARGRGEYDEKPEDWKRALTTAGLPVDASDDVLQAWAAMGDQVASAGTPANRMDGAPELEPGQMTLTNVKTIGGTNWAQQYLVTDYYGWALENKNKIVSVNGHNLLITGKRANSESTTPTGKPLGQEGLYVYDIDAGQYLVLRPAGLNAEPFGAGVGGEQWSFSGWALEPKSTRTGFDAIQDITVSG